jgi:hypothetical protein
MDSGSQKLAYKVPSVWRLNEILYPHYNETRVKEIITKYETDQLLIQRKAIGKEGFTRFDTFLKKFEFPLRTTLRNRFLFVLCVLYVVGCFRDERQDIRRLGKRFLFVLFVLYVVRCFRDERQDIRQF